MSELTDNQKLERLETLVSNVMMARQQFLKTFTDPRRSIEDECGYPPGNTQFSAEEYEQLYEREPIAQRVVQLMPKESWQVTPEVVEDEDSGKDTPFEAAWKALCKTMNTGSYYSDEQGSVVWEYLYRADVLSGIGSWGILLLGFDDGKMLQDSVDGMPKDGTPASLDITGVSQLSIAQPGVASGGEVSKDIYGEVGKDAYGGAIPVVDPQMSTLGTDALYRGTQFSPDAVDFAQEGPGGQKRARRRRPKLLFMRPYAQYLVQIVQYEADIRNPRFGHPIMYLVTLNDPRQQHTGVGLPLATVRVHWSRVIHLADERQSSEIFGIPRMRPVLNRLLDLRKLYGGGAEGYWKSCFAALSLETHPQLGGDVIVNKQATQDMMEQYMNGLQRYLLLSGMSAKTLAPQVVDPSSQVDKQIEAICIAIACPVRVFKGSERGELASSQDDQAWNDRIRHRQQLYLTPRVVCPFIDRLILAGVLPKPGEDGYKVVWPDLEALSTKDKAMIALTTTQALGAYISGNVEQLVPPDEYLSRVLEMDEDVVAEMLEGAAKSYEQGDTMTVPSQPDEEQEQQDKLDAAEQRVDAQVRIATAKAQASGAKPGGGASKPPSSNGTARTQ